ncbi:MAG: plasmid partitioning protein RepB [Mesorhizobium sp.]|uniref:plasmid partitioning protein RepB n=1 Tax=Mesorhizobium sp. TaxID=1871066 RepID=UPI000FE594A0|nr:plasmid partitioning protein RepB [Mesorhizobium sp.]RWI99760.1 MAG: plasmid partitioning protein RepB [Mesorhizobium sp.]RWM13445.1 MAG: plasmid partitioning protein RepB [Mesorhizobium sp.]
MSRKRIFANLESAPAQVGPESLGPETTEPPAARRSSRIRPLLGSPDLLESGSGSPVGALGQSLGEMNERSKRADEIEQRLISGQTIVELDTNSVEPSFIPDRMLSDDEAFRSFVEAIRNEGQQVPILVRPHPEYPAKYQVAFGHRRLRAAIELGIPVKAIVRKLTDQELVVAQGQENNERQDLSYIEKVRFAQQLERRFSRDVIMSALSVYKSDLSNMLAVGAKISVDLIEAIGPAHGVGRRNWMSLADVVADPAQLDKARAVTQQHQFAALSSKDRFEAVARSLKPGALARSQDTLLSDAGQEIGRITQSKQKVTVTIDRKSSPEFAEFVLNELPRLFKEYRQSR